jgi:hypothetical protein
LSRHPNLFTPALICFTTESTGEGYHPQSVTTQKMLHLESEGVTQGQSRLQGLDRLLPFELVKPEVLNHPLIGRIITPQVSSPHTVPFPIGEFCIGGRFRIGGIGQQPGDIHEGVVHIQRYTSAWCQVSADAVEGTMLVVDREQMLEGSVWKGDQIEVAPEIKGTHVT